MANLEKNTWCRADGEVNQRDSCSRAGPYSSTYKSELALSNRFATPESRLLAPESLFTLQTAGVSARLSGPTPHAEVASQAGVVVPPEPLLKVEYGYISY